MTMRELLSNDPVVERARMRLETVRKQLRRTGNPIEFDFLMDQTKVAKRRLRDLVSAMR